MATMQPYLQDLETRIKYLEEENKGLNGKVSLLQERVNRLSSQLLSSSSTAHAISRPSTSKGNLHGTGAGSASGDGTASSPSVTGGRKRHRSEDEHPDEVETEEDAEGPSMSVGTGTGAGTSSALPAQTGMTAAGSSAALPARGPIKFTTFLTGRAPQLSSGVPLSSAVPGSSTHASAPMAKHTAPSSRYPSSNVSSTLESGSGTDAPAASSSAAVAAPTGGASGSMPRSGSVAAAQRTGPAQTEQEALQACSLKPGDLAWHYDGKKNMYSLVKIKKSKAERGTKGDDFTIVHKVVWNGGANFEYNHDKLLTLEVVRGIMQETGHPPLDETWPPLGPEPSSTAASGSKLGKGKTGNK